MIRPFARLYRFALPLAVVTLCNLAPSTLLANTHAAHIQSQSGNASTAQAARESASAQTLELLTLHKRWLKAPASERAQLHQQLLGQAEQRRQLLDELMQSHPAEVLRVAIPVDKQRGLPPEVVAKLEQRLELEGELEVLYEDYPDGSAKLRHVLKTPFGERFELHFAQPQRQWRSGLQVRAQGWLLESAATTSSFTQGDIALSDDENGLILLADGATGTTSSDGLAYDLPNTLGAQRTLAILVNFQDAPSNKPWTLSQVESMVFGSVSDFFKENSSQQTWLTGSVAGWYTLPLSSTNCNGSDISRYAKEAAQAAGYNLAQYDRFIFAFPPISACGYSGMAQVGAWPSSAWINGSLTLRTLAHELGHNVGLHHAHAQDCGTTTLGTSCVVQEYGDTLDIMGYSGTVGHFNGFSKERLGWFGSGNLLDVSSAGSFYLEPNAKATNAAKTLRIPKGIDPSSGKQNFYYVEFRQPIGFDAQLTDRGLVYSDNVFNGVTVRQASPELGHGYLLDMTPGTTSVDMRDAALVGGQVFHDPDSGVAITTEWTDASQALVSVDFSGGSAPICTHNDPIVSMTPGQSTWLPAGSSFSYSVTVTNMDGATCASSNFSLSASLPSGWNASLPSSLSLAAGASASATLNVTAPSTASDGFYSVDVSATANNTSASTSASFVVDNPIAASNSAPTAVDDSVSLSSIAPITIAVLANDSDADGDALSIVTFNQGAKGSVKLNSNGTLTYTPAKGFKSSDQFAYSIGDGQSTASASVTISLQSSGGSGGGKGQR
ncbi:Ig-like domain-containing protein [Pseudomonas tumuqii]|uniref:Ig-like domain-containing protein n=1 Tax=Pseudomonas tumuqii TaxID=2715755 RepID=UPI00155358D8|nr:Ig-like domain-containing protein [Pseudomonas tumuqii]